MGASALVLFGITWVLVTAGAYVPAGLDAAAVASLHGFALHHTAWVQAMRTLSFLGSAATYVPLLLAAWLVLLRVGRARTAFGLTVLVVGTSSLNNAVKGVVGRSRPVLTDPVASASGLSFPSGHAQSAVVVWVLLAMVVSPYVPRRGRLAVWAGALLMILSIGLSRVALGVHYPSDVLGGYLLGVVVLCAGWPVLTWWDRPGAPHLEGSRPGESD